MKALDFRGPVSYFCNEVYTAPFATVLLGLASYAAAGGFTAPSAYAASVYGPAIGSVGHGYGGRGYLPQAYNLQMREQQPRRRVGARAKAIAGGNQLLRKPRVFELERESESVRRSLRERLIRPPAGYDPGDLLPGKPSL
ncbi:hypothetical protein HPB52_009325 [Rhipicephalus sanguineus]|uniref:Uncharacterized protein n=1 Tax=Rhipicephalus sanguineus TaxID=34632 RepID=A0A9D4PI03_RHISA|nr:hypothetical protein HPB52_009325 [Rhipicephalus sanguineus]